MGSSSASSITSFRDLGVSDAVIDTLAKRGIHEPFPIQVMVIQDATSGRDTLAKSQTGSGKTLGFAIPIVEQLSPDDTKHPGALILVPTRELAQQVKDDLVDIARAKRLKTKVVYGGTRVTEQSKGVGDAHILIATPGRLQDLADRKLVKLDGVKIFVLDEADRMLDMGFQPQVDRIVRLLPKDRQTMFFSATLDGAVGRIADVYTKNPVRHEIESDGKTVEEADHRFVPGGLAREARQARRAGERAGGPDAGVREHEAPGRVARPTAPRAGRADRDDARRHDAAGAREGAAAVRGQARGGLGRDRRRGARPGPRRHHARRELRPAARGQGIRAPCRTDRARRHGPG